MSEGIPEISAPYIQEHTISPERLREPQFDVAIAFGQGPIQDAGTKRKAESVENQNPSVQEEINSWGKTTAIAMGYLHERGLFREAVFSGGKTGGNQFLSEAQHMHAIASQVFSPIADRYTHIEDGSTNTLSNFENTLNLIDRLSSQDPEKVREFLKFALVCSDFHASRIRMMAKLYNLQDITVFSSEQVLKVMANDPNFPDAKLQEVANILIPDRDLKSKDFRGEIAAWIDERIDPVNLLLNRSGEDKGLPRSFIGGGRNISARRSGFNYFEKQADMYPNDEEGNVSEEGKDSMQRRRNEDMFSEGLANVPANWVGFIADIKSDERFLGILQNIEHWNPGFIGKLGVNLSDIASGDFLYKVREQLRPYKDKPHRQFVSLDWNPWEEGVSEKLEGLIAKGATQTAK